MWGSYCFHFWARGLRPQCNIGAPCRLMTHDHDQLPQSEASSPTSEPTLQTPRGKKRTLKDLSVEKMTTSRKMPRTEAQKSGDNEKKAECSVCHTPRSNDQRGSVCVTCLQSFRKLTGHQNVSKCKHDTELMQKVVSSSKSLREQKPGQRSRETRTLRRELHDMECMLQLLVDHHGLQQ